METLTKHVNLMREARVRTALQQLERIGNEVTLIAVDHDASELTEVRVVDEH